MLTKKAIRGEIAESRKVHSAHEVSEKSERIAERLFSLKEYRDAKRILTYVEMPAEVRTRNIITQAWKDGKEVAVPKCVGRDLVFYRLTDFSQLRKGFFGIDEPAAGETVDWPDALVLMPGVAFDRDLHRIGYGGGFYDRFLSDRKELFCIGLAFSFQFREAVPWEETDISPEILITEEEILFKFS